MSKKAQFLSKNFLSCFNVLLCGSGKNIKTVVKSEIKMLTENTMLTSFIFDYLNNIYEEKLDLNSICQNF